MHAGHFRANVHNGPGIQKGRLGVVDAEKTEDLFLQNSYATHTHSLCDPYGFPDVIK
jgi:hypothetical protein